MTQSDVAQRAADLLIRARRERTQFSVEALGGDLASFDDAYAVQDRVADALGWFEGTRATAWKAGASAPGATPIAVPLPTSGVVASPARYGAGAFHSIRIEAEIAFRFGDGVAHPQRASDWKTSVDALVVTIEVVDSRIADGDRASPRLKLADAQQHGGLVVGSSVPRRDVDWKSLHAIVRRNGAIVADTHGGHPLGDPTVLLPWFVAHVAARGRDLAAGDLVTAGTWTGMVAASPGDAVEVEFDGIGRAAASF